MALDPSKLGDWTKLPAIDDKELVKWLQERRLEMQTLKNSSLDNLAAGFKLLEFYLIYKDEYGEERVKESYKAVVDLVGGYSWENYVALQKKINQQKAEKEKQEALEKALNAGRQRAVDAAVKKRNGYKNPQSTTVIAGLSEIEEEKVWVGLSGVGNHSVRLKAQDGSNAGQQKAAQQVLKVMDELFTGVKQLEEWPVNACGEVDAMEQYLFDKQIFAVKDIPHWRLCSHAETWDATHSRWKARSACSNCDQWLSKIETYRS